MAPCLIVEDDRMQPRLTDATLRTEGYQVGRIDATVAGLERFACVSAAAHTESIVRPFFSTSNQGTGLGLSIVDRGCRLVGGSLQWSNAAGGGCQFSVTLPGM